MIRVVHKPSVPVHTLPSTSFPIFTTCKNPYRIREIQGNKIWQKFIQIRTTLISKQITVADNSDTIKQSCALRLVILVSGK
jgi:hypothetical protein